MKKKFTNQPALFDYKPEPTVKGRVYVKQPEVEVVYIIYYKNGTDVAHQSCPINNVDYFTSGRDDCEKIVTFSWDEYWQKFHSNYFQLGRP